MTKKRENNVVFVHSSFRTSSTWFWSAFRKKECTWSYCEIFHEALAHLKPSEADQHDYRSWQSKHSATPPYFMEYIPTLKSSGGIHLYETSMAFERFIPEIGIRGSISQNELSYISSLIDLGHRLGRIPVLTGTRTLGRIWGLRQAFPGIHIFIYRNLFHQWISYCNQAELGNPYFMKTLTLTTEALKHTNFSSFLIDYLKIDKDPTKNTNAAYPINEKSFTIFFAVHLYLYLNAMLVADLTVDVNMLANNQVYRKDIESHIRNLTNVEIDLSNARESIEGSSFQISDIDEFRIRLDAITARTLECFSDTNNEDNLRKFANTLRDDLLRELTRHRFYASSTQKFFQVKMNPLHSEKQQASNDQTKFSENFSDLQKRLATVESDLGTLAAEKEAAKIERSRLADQLAMANQRMMLLMNQRDALLSSTSWKISAPIRTIGKLVRKIRSS